MGHHSRNRLPLLNLVRAPNCLTAMADVLGGIALAGCATLPNGWWAAIVGSALLYAGGMVFNDLWDLRKDRVLHPDRALPRGEISPIQAAGLGIVLLFGGLTLSLVGPIEHQVITALLIVSILAYDRLPSTGRVMGPLLMGSCRGLNMARGITLADPLPTEVGAWVPVVLYALIVMVITVVSTGEEHPLSRRALLSLVCVLAAAYLAPALIPLLEKRFLVAALLFVPGGLLAVYVAKPIISNVRPMSLVPRAVFTLPLYQTLVAASRECIALAVGALALFGLAIGLKKWMRQEGS